MAPGSENSETERAAARALQRSGVLGSEPDEALSDLAQLARSLLAASAVTIGFVSDGAERIKAAALEPGATLAPADLDAPVAFGARARDADGILEAELRSDLRCRAHPWVAGAQAFRRAAGVPILAAGGAPMGALCAYWRDDRPALSEEEKIALFRLAGQVREILRGRELFAVLKREFMAHQAARVQLQEQREFSGLLIHSSMDGIVAFDTELCCTEWNPATARLKGMTRIDALGRPLAEVFPEICGEGDLSRVLEGRSLVLRNRSVVHLGSSSMRCCQVHLSPLFNESGTPVGGFGILHDVTEEKELQRKLLHADRMAAVGTLAAGVAHEINNPLTYVITNLSLISEELGEMDPGAWKARLQSMLEDALEGATRVREIVRGLKVFSRVEEGRIGPVDAVKVLESAITMASNEIRHRARLVRDFAPAPPVRANEGRLLQVVLNLLVNAAQSIPEGNANRNVIHAAVRPLDGARMVIEVRDTGCGIPPENLEQIFDPFFTTKPVGVGTGLGLAICHGIVQSFGGEIQVESEPGRGSTFRLVLPAMTAAEQAGREQRDLVRPAARAGKAQSPGMRILIVDDEPALTEGIRRALEPEHEVRVAPDGRSALGILETDGAFDLVLCDVMMPEMGAPEVYDQLRRLRPGLEERMVFMTGGAFTPRAAEFLAGVSNQRIEKPFDTQALRDVLRGFSQARAKAAPPA